MKINLLSKKEFTFLTIVGNYGNDRVWPDGIKPNQIVAASGKSLREKEVISLVNSLKKKGLVESHDSDPNSFLITSDGVRLFLAYGTLVKHKHIVY